MATMSFPPGNWNQTVTNLDTIVLQYTSSYPGVNLTLFCETAKGTGNYIWWNLPGPLPANASYNLHLQAFKFQNYINLWPTNCHFDLMNSNDKAKKVNGGFIPLTTAAAGKAETTWSQSTTGTSRPTTTISTLPSPTAVSSGTSSISFAPAPAPTSTNTSDSDADSSSQGLSQSARIGIGVGASLGGALLIVLSILAVILYRRSKRTHSPPIVDNVDDPNFVKAELVGSSVGPMQPGELPAPLRSPASPQGKTGSYYSADSRHSQWGPPQELAAAFPSNDVRLSQNQPVQRYELGA